MKPAAEVTATDLRILNSELVRAARDPRGRDRAAGHQPESLDHLRATTAARAARRLRRVIVPSRILARYSAVWTSASSSQRGRRPARRRRRRDDAGARAARAWTSWYLRGGKDVRPDIDADTAASRRLCHADVIGRCGDLSATPAPRSAPASSAGRTSDGHRLQRQREHLVDRRHEVDGQLLAQLRRQILVDVLARSASAGSPRGCRRAAPRAPSP